MRIAWCRHWVDEPHRVWVTDFTRIRTHEGALYLAVVLDLFSRRVLRCPMQPRIDRRGNCHGNAVLESFFQLQLLERERIRRKTYPDREAARQDVFDCIKMVYNPKRRHGNNHRRSPVAFERQY